MAKMATDRHFTHEILSVEKEPERYQEGAFPLVPVLRSYHQGVLRISWLCLCQLCGSHP